MDVPSFAKCDVFPQPRLIHEADTHQAKSRKIVYEAVTGLAALNVAPITGSDRFSPNNNPENKHGQSPPHLPYQQAGEQMNSCGSGWSFSVPVILVLIACFCITLVGRWISRKSDFPGRGSFVLLHFAAAFWMLMAAVEMASLAPACKMLWASLAWPAIVATPTFWALFLWQYVNSDTEPLRPRTLIALGLVSLIACLLALSNPFHGLFYLAGTGPVSEELGAPLRYVHGPLFFAVAIYVYCAMLICAGVVLHAAFFSQGMHRRHFLAFLAITTVPLIAHVAYVGYGWTVFGFDPTSFSFIIVLFAFFLLIFSGRMFDLLPIAQHLLQKVLLDPVLVVNSRGEVLQANPAALELACLSSDWQGMHLADWPVYGRQLADFLKQPGAGYLPPLMELENPRRFFEIRHRSILRAAGSGSFVLGEMLYLRDVTEPHLSKLRLAGALAESEERLKTISRLHEQVREQVLHDPLTGLYNRRYLDEFFNREKSRVCREDAELVLVLIDLDNFKLLNDTYGHMVGDEVLRAVASFFEHELRSTDVLFRIGGEEFLLMLPGLDAQQAFARVECLREKFAATAVHTRVGAMTVFFSAGLACRREHGDELDELMQAADSALYQAKREGRNSSRLATGKSLASFERIQPPP